ncbi:MAG TPA: YbaB/EbfC family nucleoid-associated protein [Myxococcales bacterium]|nr:YbaB/EbfC family nucleoid-associated protein [Myxococcales bacterium]
MELDLGKLMQQAQALQGELKRKQEELARQEVSAQAGAGLVTAVVNGRGELLCVKIDPKLDLGDRGLLEDLVTAAVNAALARSRELQQKELAGGLPLGSLLGG